MYLWNFLVCCLIMICNNNHQFWISKYNWQWSDLLAFLGGVKCNATWIQVHYTKFLYIFFYPTISSSFKAKSSKSSKVYWSRAPNMFFLKTIFKRSAEMFHSLHSPVSLQKLLSYKLYYGINYGHSGELRMNCWWLTILGPTIVTQSSMLTVQNFSVFCSFGQKHYVQVVA